METETRSIHAFREGDLFDNRYRLVKRAGSGGFADVWKAEDTLRKNRSVALKIYTRLDEEGIKEMSDEYDETEYIRHPNLLTGNHFAAVGNIPYMEMRYCDGGNMSRRAGKIKSEEMRKMMCDIVGGLAYLHSQGIVHQDIKPENILYDGAHNTYLLADFGISSKSRTRMSKSVNMASSAVSMTMAYAPPEKFSSNPVDRLPDSKGDIFSLGITIYELTTGMLPFDQPVNTGDRMLEKEGNIVIYYENIVDPLLRSIVEQCLRYRKDERPTANEILKMLNEKESVGSQNSEPELDNSAGSQQGTDDGLRTVRINFNDATVNSVNQETATQDKPSDDSKESTSNPYIILYIFIGMLLLAAFSLLLPALLGA